MVSSRSMGKFKRTLSIAEIIFQHIRCGIIKLIQLGIEIVSKFGQVDAMSVTFSRISVKKEVSDAVDAFRED